MFKLTDPFGTAPSQAPFTQSVSTGVPWHNLPVTREYTLGQLLDQTIARCGENDAVVYADRDFRLTWYEFGEEVDRLARGLMALGVKKGEKIALWATNVPHWVVLMFAAAKIGAILLPLNTNYKEHEMDFALGQSDAENLFIISGYRDCSYVDVIYTLVPELREQPRGELKCEKYPHLKRVMFLGGEKHRGMYSLNEVMALAVETPWEDYLKRQAECDVNDVVNMQYTSGTTGFPKGVQLTHRNIGNDGFWIGACQNLSSRAIQVMMSIEREKCTATYGVPTMYIAILDHPLFPKFDFRSLRTGIMSGSACPTHRMQQVFDRMFMKEVTNPYGLTESGPVMTMTRYFEPSIERKCQTIGQALPGIEVAIIDPESGEIAPIGQDGEICCRGFNTMKGYYKMPEQTAACIDEKGWLHSGDIGRMDADEVYLLLKETDNLPEQYIMGSRMKKSLKNGLLRRLGKKSARGYLLAGVSLLLFSLISIFPVYYIVAGGLMLAAAVLVRIFGKV